MRVSFQRWTKRPEMGRACGVSTAQMGVWTSLVLHIEKGPQTVLRPKFIIVFKSLGLEGRVEVFFNFLKKSHSGEPFLVRANQQSEVLGHVTAFNSVHDHAFKRFRKT